MSAFFSFLSDVSDKEEEVEEKKSLSEQQPTQTKTGKKRKGLTEPLAKAPKKKKAGQVLLFAVGSEVSAILSYAEVDLTVESYCFTSFLGNMTSLMLNLVFSTWRTEVLFS